MKCLTAGLADRLSKVADVPVAPNEGLTKFICGICFLSAESFITTAKASYEKNKATPSGTGGAMAHELRSHEREPRIPVALRHLLTLPSVDLWPSG